jgi:hypothetical protein
MMNRKPIALQFRDRLQHQFSAKIEDRLNNQICYIHLQLEDRLYEPIRNQLRVLRARLADEIWVKLP